MHMSLNQHSDELSSETVLSHLKPEIAQILMMRVFVIPRTLFIFRKHSGLGSSGSDDKGHEQLLSLEGMLDQVNEVHTHPL